MIILKVGIPESFKVEWYPHKITGSSHPKAPAVKRSDVYKNHSPLIARPLSSNSP